MSDWVLLRDHLYQHFAEQVDHAILHDPDRELAALLAANRERVLNMLVDQAELAALRGALADSDHLVADREPAIRLNGNGSGKRVVRVQ